MFCRGHLGTNEVVEHLAVGRKLAYDQERGRLWVVCGRCDRWNLTPFEERWEAIEESERAFRESRLTASTENIGVARTPEGLELVRVGRPHGRELAAWRWSRRFGARHRRAVRASGVIAGGMVAGNFGNLVFGGAAFPIIGAFASLAMVLDARAPRRLVRTRTEAGEEVEFHQLTTLRAEPPDAEGRLRLRVPHPWRDSGATVVGVEAERVAAFALPAINRAGGGQRHVEHAATAIEDAGGTSAFVRSVWSDRVLLRQASGSMGRAGEHGLLSRLPIHVRLGLEMALHDTHERAALRGELAVLERMWRDAEELAAISDSLLTPRGWRDFVRRHRRGTRDPE